MEVQLELQVLPGEGQAVAVSLHLAGDCGTPIRSFSSPLVASMAAAGRQAESPSPALAEELPGGYREHLLVAASGIPGDPDSVGLRSRCSGTAAAAPASTAAAAPPAPTPSSFEQQLEQAAAAAAAAEYMPALREHAAATAAAPAQPAAEAPVAAARATVETCSRGGSPRGASAASLDAVMALLQQVLESSSAAVQQAQEVAAAPLAAAPLPASVDKLLALELEVVQLQQSLQIAELEFESRTVQLHSLKQRADEAQQSGRVAEEQADRLRQQLGAAHTALEREQGAQRRAATAHQQQLAALQEQLAAARRESGELAELRAHVAAACSALQALGVAPTQIFSRAALQLAGVPAEAYAAPPQPQRQLPQPLPAAQLQQPMPVTQPQQPPPPQQQSQQAAAAPAPAPPPPPPPQPPPLPAQQQQQHAMGRPQVPRLQLSSISLEQLQQAATREDGGTPTSRGLPPLPAASQRYSHLRVAVAASPRDAGHAPSPARSVQCSTELAPPLTARRAMSPAQQELLASARQWRQLTARSVVAEEGENAADRAPAPRPQQQQHQQQQAGAAAGGHATPRGAAPFGAAPRPPLRAVQTARQHHATPRKQAAAPRWTYEQDPAFLEIRKAYRAVVSSEADSDARWARSVFSSSSAVETDPKRVEPVVQGLLQLFRESGVAIPLQRVAPCQYRLGASKLAVRLVNGRLMARAGAGQTVDVLDWLGRQPVPS